MTTSTKTLPTTEVASRLQLIINELSDQFPERRQLFTALALATLAKQHTFILGPPGTAKSMAVRWFYERITDSNFFEVAMSPTRPMEAVAGPADLPALRDHGILRYKSEGYLPWAHFGMVDEIGKISMATGNAMLAMLNERIFHTWDDVNQRPWVHIPLYSVAGGSNEIPGEDATDASAFYDRFVFRVEVRQVQETASFVQLVTGSMTNAGTTIDFPSLAHVIDAVVPDVLMPKEVADAFVSLREKLQVEGIEISNRRWVQAALAVKANAVLNGRVVTEPEDLEALQFVLWETPDQIPLITRTALSVGSPLAALAADSLASLEEIALLVRDTAKIEDDNEKAGKALNHNAQVKAIIAELEKAKKRAQTDGSSTSKLDVALTRAADVSGTIKSLLGF